MAQRTGNSSLVLWSATETLVSLLNLSLLGFRGTCSPSQLKQIPAPALITPVLIAPKGFETSGSGRMGGICARLFSFPSEDFYEQLYSLKPAPVAQNILRCSRLIWGSGSRAYQNVPTKKTVNMDGLLDYSNGSYNRLGPVHLCLYVWSRETSDWDFFRGLLKMARAETKMSIFVTAFNHLLVMNHIPAREWEGYLGHACAQETSTTPRHAYDTSVSLFSFSNSILIHHRLALNREPKLKKRS